MPPPYTCPVLSYTTKTNKVDLVDASHINALQTEQIAQNNRLLNMIDSDGTLRSGSAFPSPTLATQMFYRTDLDANYIRDAANANWVSQSAALNLVSNTSISAASNSGDISITNTKTYKVIVSISLFSAASNEDQISLRFNNDGTGIYGYVVRGFDTATTAINDNTASTATRIKLGSTTNLYRASSSHNANFEFFIFPSQSSATGYIKGSSWGYTKTGGIGGFCEFMGMWPGAATITSFRIITETANMTGNVYLYEVRQS